MNFSKVSKKLKQWQEADLIDKQTASKISAFEQQNTKPIALWAFAGLGIFAIILGLISVISSNWWQTPTWVKLTTDLLLCLFIALALYRVISQKNSNKLLTELLIIFYYGFTLASMALIGQTYQLGGSIAQLLLVWTLITIPIVLLGRGKFLAILWIISTSITYILNIIELAQITNPFISQPYLWQALIGSLEILAPLFFMLLSRIPWLLSNRPLMAQELSYYSWLVIIVEGWFSHLLWYETITGFTLSIQILLVICLVATTTIVTFIPKLYSTKSPDTHLAMRITLISTFIIGAFALWYNVSNPLLGALINIAYMLILAWVALKIQSIKIFNVMTALISIRLLFIYFEVFGSLFETGLGLVAGGLITLAVVWLWLKKSHAIASFFGLSLQKKQGDLNDK